MKRQQALLALEREAEVAETAALLQGLPLRQLCQRGAALQKLFISGSRTGLYGRTILSFTQRSSVEFQAHNLSSGDIVGVITQVTVPLISPFISTIGDIKNYLIPGDYRSIYLPCGT